jgi:SAM-dependent methyltransferase
MEADAGAVPLPDATFDLVVSECGASLWCDPVRWVPEAAPLLRPGGRLVFHSSRIQRTGPVKQAVGAPDRARAHRALDRRAPAKASRTAADTCIAARWT